MITRYVLRVTSGTCLPPIFDHPSRGGRGSRLVLEVLVFRTLSRVRGGGGMEREGGTCVCLSPIYTSTSLACFIAWL